MEQSRSNLKESLIQTLDHHVCELKEKYYIELAESSKNHVILEMLFDNSLKNIVFKLADIMREKLNYSDIIGAFISQSSDILPINVDLTGKKIIKLNFFPNVIISKCSFCGLFCCKCKKKLRMRKIKVRNVLK